MSIFPLTCIWYVAAPSTFGPQAFKRSRNSLPNYIKSGTDFMTFPCWIVASLGTSSI